VYSQEVVLRLVERIYAAAGDLGLWAEFLDDLAGLLNSGTANLLAYDVGRKDTSISASIGTDSGIVRRYEEHFAPLDPWFNAGGPFIANGGVFAGQMVIPDSEYENTEFYQDFIRPLGVFHQVAAVIGGSPGRVAVVSAQRARKYGAFGDAELQLFGQLLPHFRQALRLHRQFAGLQLTADSLEDVLDRMPIGVVLADAKGNSVHHNHRAQSIFNLRDGLELRRSGLWAGTPKHTAHLKALIGAAARRLPVNSESAGGTMLITRPSLKRPYSILVTQVPPGNVRATVDRSCVAIFITDPEQKPDPARRILSALFGFSQAEVKLAVLLMQGESLDNAAERLGVSRNTVRSQLAQLLGKTGTHRQSELLQLLLRSPASLE
jgi:DNA-binding CsgD family transcriptional regulator/PAS domain-containing protein